MLKGSLCQGSRTAQDVCVRMWIQPRNSLLSQSMPNCRIVSISVGITGRSEKIEASGRCLSLSSIAATTTSRNLKKSLSAYPATIIKKTEPLTLGSLGMNQLWAQLSPAIVMDSRGGHSAKARATRPPALSTSAIFHSAATSIARIRVVSLLFG